MSRQHNNHSANLSFSRDSLAFALTLISTLEFCFSRNSWRSMAANTSDLGVRIALYLIF
jgi:hypothetical protein